ncbi:GATA transcription factor 18-like [Cornus florida]|uniref:GATA transcription factor 18-like n=1 Tax=Cornus florida TaxID=4283 RepID=UPI00289991F2|nr:GATA transcription factor 18-like [Cornus florida]
MHRCSSSSHGGNMVGPCGCGLYHSPTNCFSMLFSMPHEENIYPFTSSPSSSSPSVDCTLSLGTPSTRLTTNDNDNKRSGSNSCMPNFYWDILQSKTTSTTNSHSPTTPHKSSRGSCGGGGGSNSGGGGSSDPLLARRCANCDTTSTPLWRNGPRGPKSLCNACGIRFKKEERRANAAAIAANGGGAASGMMEAQHMMGHHNSSWVHHSQAQKMNCLSPGIGNEFRFMEDDDRDTTDTTTGGIPFLSWRLNVPDRPSLVHDFTR